MDEKHVHTNMFANTSSKSITKTLEKDMKLLKVCKKTLKLLKLLLRHNVSAFLTNSK